MPKAFSLYFEIIVLLGLPLYFMSASDTLLAARPWLLAIGGLYCAAILVHSRATFTDIGLTLGHLQSSLTSLILPSLTIILLVIILLAASSPPERLWWIGTDPLSIPSLSVRLVYYIFGSAPVQELIFRGYLTYRLRSVFANLSLIKLLSIGVFTLAHLPFKSPVMLLVALFMGTIYFSNYRRFGNLLAVSASHALVGACLIWLRNYYLPYT